MISKKSMNGLGRILIGTHLLMLFGSLPARAQVIGLFADEAGSQCNIRVPPGSPTEAYLLLEPGNLDGAIGVVMGIRGLPAGWYGYGMEWIYGAYIPSLFGNGAAHGFTNCHSGNPILLEEVWIVATSAANNVVLELGPRIPPLAPDQDCPLILLCDSPTFTAQCVRSRPAYINSTEPCSVAVDQLSWGACKELFR